MKQSSRRAYEPIDTETRTTAVFTLLGLLLAYGAGGVTDSRVVQVGLLFGVGAVAPTLLNVLWR